ncbi:MAG: WYL domain-containing protein [Actinomycetota bacterium]
MRTDRLVAILLLLQRREQVTAAQVARELEISERTARRDLDALVMAGVPLYSVQGRGGGWRLIGGARTDLSGLTAHEARDLFLVAGSAPTTPPTVKAALRKLAHALPEPFRDEAEAAAASLVLDSRRWGAPSAGSRVPPQLDDLRDAVIRGVQVRLGYVAAGGDESERIVHPLGLVAKDPSWYLVADTDAGRRTFRVDRVSSVELTDEPARRPDDFDLAAAWDEIAEGIDQLRTPLEVTAVCSPDGIGPLRMMLGDRLEIRGATDDGRIDVLIRGHSEFVVAGELAWMVEWLDVTGPPGVRDHLAEIGRGLVERYG